MYCLRSFTTCIVTAQAVKLPVPPEPQIIPLFIPAKRAKHRHPDVSYFGIEGRQQAEENLTRDASEATGSQHPLQPREFGNVDNTPLLAFLQVFKITTCYGCKNKFAQGLKKTPEDLILKLLVKRDRLVNQKWIPGCKNSWAYFHLSLN